MQITRLSGSVLDAKQQYGLKTIPPGGITCSIAASKKEAQAIMSFFSGAIVLVYET
jgi:hypothetical protein